MVGSSVGLAPLSAGYSLLGGELKSLSISLYERERLKVPL
jgi:hypothetical protein